VTASPPIFISPVTACPVDPVKPAPSVALFVTVPPLVMVNPFALVTAELDNKSTITYVAIEC